MRMSASAWHFRSRLARLRLQELFLQDRPAEARAICTASTSISTSASAPPCAGSATARIDRVIGTSATASAVVCAMNRIPRSRRDEADRQRATTAADPQTLSRSRRFATWRPPERSPGIGPRRAEIIVPGIGRPAARPGSLQHARAVLFGAQACATASSRISRRAARGSDWRSFPPNSAAWWRTWPNATACRFATRAKWRGWPTIFHRLPVLAPAAARITGRLLEAASYLHDIGHYVSDTRHHKHSYYLVANSDMPGFTQDEREIIANLCRYHRKALAHTGT